MACVAVAFCCSAVYLVAHHTVVDTRSSALAKSEVIIAAKILSMQRIERRLAYLHLGSVCVYKGEIKQNETHLPVNVGEWGQPGVATGWPMFRTNGTYLLFLAKPQWYSRFYYLLQVAEDNDSWRSYLRSEKAEPR